MNCITILTKFEVRPVKLWLQQFCKPHLKGSLSKAVFVCEALIRAPTLGCYPPFATYERVENGTIFTSIGDYVVDTIASSKNIPVNYLTEEELYSGYFRLGMMPFPQPIDFKWYNYGFDFSPSLSAHGEYIFSRKNVGFLGSVIQNIFDSFSYGLIVFSTAMLMVVLWTSFKCFDGKKTSL